MTLVQARNVFIYTLLGERKRKGMGFCGCYKEIEARIPQLLADTKKRKLFKTHENTVSWALFYGRFVSLSARKYKSKHENSVILILHAWLKLLLKTDEEISKLNCNAKT